MDDNQIKTDQLPAVSPDLLLVRWGEGSWKLKSLSDRMAQWTRTEPTNLSGRSTENLFPQAIPPLSQLASEVLEQGHDLNDIKLRLHPDLPELLADIQFAGLTEDYLGQLVRITLRRESTASKLDTGFRGLVGSSAGMREVFRKIRLYGASDASVVITGETGAGKELVAHALHQESSRKDGPYAALNCTAISEQLLESELFGHERGAFTGAVREHRGYFERSDGGSLFLDEIGDMPLHTQSKLLRVLEDGYVQRVGSERGRRVDVRVIGATNVPLEQAVAEKRFRADLYHRIAVLRIHLPPLRERLEDIPLLAESFLQEFNAKYNKGVRRLTVEAIRLLQAYLWPGNVRELRNVLERVVVETEAEAISARAFAEWIQERQQFATQAPMPPNLDRTNLPMMIPYAPASGNLPVATPFMNEPAEERQELTPESIRQAYRACGGNLSAVARQLGVHRATLYRHMERLGLDRQSLA